MTDVPAGDGVTAVVLNWHTPELTERSVHALIADGVPAERVLVVDNGSADGSPERLRATLEPSPVLALPDNIGFARANNAGARALPARRAYLLVNSDAFVHRPGTIARLLKALEDPAVGIAVPRLLGADLTLQRSVYPLSTPLPELIRAAGASRFVPQALAPRLGAHWDHGRTRRVQAAVGAVLAVRALAWDQLGGFDERRFMYAEDHDLFWRLAALGWHAMFVADAEFVHLGGASSQSRWDDPGRAERVARAEAAMLADHLGPLRRRVTLAAMMGGVGARALVHRVRGNEAASRTQLGWLRGYRAGSRRGTGL